MDQLLLLRDPRLQEFSEQQLETLSNGIKDYNVRLLAEGGQLHAMCGGKHYRDADPFALFAQLLEELPERMTPSHAFYLGYELCKAATAMTLSKEYRQDESLDWGYLTVAEAWHRLKRDRSAE